MATVEKPNDADNNKAKIYLYKEGNECTTITGGWTYTQGGWDNNKGTGGVTKNADNMYIWTNDAYNGELTITLSPVALKLVNVYMTKMYVDCSYNNNYENSNYESFMVNGVEVVGMPGYSSASRAVKSGDINAVVTNVSCLARNWSTRGAGANIYNVYMESGDIISVPSYNQGSLSVSLDSLNNNITFKDLTFIWNDNVLNTYETISATDTVIEYTLDDSAMFYGDNEVTVQVTYNQGDGLPDEVLTMTYVYNKCVILETVDEQIPDLVANTSPREFLDRIYMVNDVINKYRSNMYKLLEYKGFQVEENLRLNDLIILIWNMIYEGSVEETVRQKMITVLRNKGISISGDETISELIDMVDSNLN